MSCRDTIVKPDRVPVVKHVRWQVRAAGLPCRIEGSEEGWVVTLASVSVARGLDLADTIIEATGGLVEKEEARRLASAVFARLASAADPAEAARSPQGGAVAVDRGRS
jgi:hypothetical protein